MAQDTTTLIARRPPEATSAGGPPDQSQGDELLARAAAWQNVAQRARESCQRGDDATQELRRRRNTSGE
jgi:hypothetical protein